MKLLLAATVLAWTAMMARAVDEASPALIPMPQKVEIREGSFQLTPKTVIVTDSAASEPGRNLAERLRYSTGYPLAKSTRIHAPSRQSIFLTTTDADANLGVEGYQLTVKSNSVVIRALTQAGVFYGVQSLLQLFPPQVFSPTPVKEVDWRIPCVQLEDQPRFKWRGVMLDVSRHFFTATDVKRLLELMALHKLNTFHWHLVDNDGWRIEIKKYPLLTSKAAWRKEIGYGLEPRSSKTYDPAGRYGGFYTQAEIREIVAYATARHITIVPEIEMPGHSVAALNAYPEFNCSDTAGGSASALGVYCAGQDGTFEFLENVFKEVFELFPGKYIHVGGDEVSKENWKRCPRCRARMKREGLKDEHELQSYFIRRMEKFINAHGRTLVGWSEIRQGGLAQNAVMMDWIGGAVESASEGHDVVMSPGDYCYFDHYQSLDYSREPVAIACYLPLRQVYRFEPIPAGLAPEFHQHILGGQANLWTEYIASPEYLDYMTFPRLCALAEAVWSPRESRQWDDFLRRLQTHCRRLDQLEVNHRVDTSVKIGEWSPGQISTQPMTLEWDVTTVLGKANPRQVIIDDKTRDLTPDLISEPGKCHVVFDYRRGNALKISSVALLENGREISSDKHAGIAGPEPRDLVSRDVVYVLTLSAGRKGRRYTVQARVAAEGSNDSYGDVTIDPSVRGKVP